MQWCPPFVEGARALKCFCFEVAALSESLFYQSEACGYGTGAHAAAMEGSPACLVLRDGMLDIYHIISNNNFEQMLIIYWVWNVFLVIVIFIVAIRRKKRESLGIF